MIMMLFHSAGEDGGVGMEVARKMRGTSGSSLEAEDGVDEPTGRRDRRRILIQYGG